MTKIYLRSPRIQQTLATFESLMTQMARKLNDEGHGRDQTLDREMAKQFSRVTDEMSHRPRGQSLLYFSWRVYEGVSNHFWLSSAMPEDRPSIIKEGARPFLCVHKFEALDTSAMSFGRMVNFIRCNGDKRFHWPKKPKLQRKLERDAKKEQYLKTKLDGPGYDRSNPIVISPVQSTLPPAPVASTIPEKTDSFVLPRPRRLALSSADKTHSFSPPLPYKVYDTHNTPKLSPHRGPLTSTSINPRAHNLYDEDIEMADAPLLAKSSVTSIAKFQAPRLSAICQPGWDLNNRAIWIPVSGIQSTTTIVPSQTSNPQPIGPVEPLIGNVSFKKASEKDVEAFLSGFLGSEEV